MKKQEINEIIANHVYAERCLLDIKELIERKIQHQLNCISNWKIRLKELKDK